MRFTLHRSSTEIASVRDIVTGDVLAGPIDYGRALRVQRAANVADAKLTTLRAASARDINEEVSVRVTADSAAWSVGLCLTCGNDPCTFTDECIAAAADEADLPQSLTVALPVDALQALLGAEIMRGHLDALRGETVYVVDTDLNRDVLAGLQTLIEWRSQAVEALARAEHDLRSLIASVPTP